MVIQGGGYWKMRGMVASYNGYKTVSVNVPDHATHAEKVEAVEHRIKTRVAESAGWQPHAVEVLDIQIKE